MGQDETRGTGYWITALCMVGMAMASVPLSGELSFLGCLLIGFLIGELWRLRWRVNWIEAQLLKRPLAAQGEATAPKPAAAAAAAIVAPRPSVPTATHIPVDVAVPSPVAAESVSVTPPPPFPVATTTHPTPAPSPSPAATPPAPGLIDTALAAALAWLRGGNTVARIGIVILFFGGIFLVKYAADHGHLPIEWRLASIAAGALGLLGFGYGLRRRRATYAQTLQGGGIAGFYLVVFAAARLYTLLPFPLALGLMVGIAVAGAVLAVTQNALALAVLGIGGGFLAPLLLSIGSGSALALFTYYTLLNLGIFAIAWFRAWRVLNLMGFVFTFGIAGLFRSTDAATAQALVGDGFLLLFFAMYLAVTVLFALRQPTALKHYVSGSLVFGLPLVTFSLHASYVHSQPFAMAWSALAFGLLYLVLGTLLLRRRDPRLQTLAEAFAALGVIFASLAVPLAFDGQTTASLWAVEGAGLVWLGLRQSRALMRSFGLGLQLIGGIAFWSRLNHLHSSTPFLNAGFIGCLLLGGSAVLSAIWLRPREGAFLDRRDHEKGVEIMALAWGLLWIIGSTLTELARALPTLQLMADLVFAAILTGSLLAGAQRLRWPLLQWLGLSALVLSGGLGLAAAAQGQHPFTDFALIGWQAWFAAGLWAYRVVSHTDGLPTEAPMMLRIGLLLTAVLIVTWELCFQIGREIGGVWPLLPIGLVPGGVLWLLARARPWPMAAVDRPAAGAPLAVVVALWVLGLSLGSDGDPQGLVYLPLLNPLDLGVMLAAVATLAWWRQLSAAQHATLTADDPRIPLGATTALLFIWLSSALLRALHYLCDVEWTADALFHSTLAQGALSIFWGLLGFIAMMLGARQAKRVVWLAGASLMAVVVIKLFLIDTATAGTLTRVFSFLAVGGLLLLTGYFAPLPPRPAEPTAPPESS